MGAIFEKYSGMIIGIIVAVVLIGVVILIGNQFKTSSSSQFEKLETIVNQHMEDL